MDYYRIGARIRKIRKANRLSQEELAEKVDISVTHMSHIETGNTKLSLQVLVDIARALEVRTDDLLSENSTYGKDTAISEIAAIMDQCTVAQAKAIVDVVQATKLAMDKYL